MNKKFIKDCLLFLLEAFILYGLVHILRNVISTEDIEMFFFIALDLAEHRLTEKLKICNRAVINIIVFHIKKH